jgi:putative restriction endonuclease
VCDFDLPELLDEPHLIPKKYNGTDDPRNGIVLCSLHHRALDAGLFCIDPETLRICYREKGPDATTLRITRSDLHHIHELPHPIALKWVMDNWME